MRAATLCLLLFLFAGSLRAQDAFGAAVKRSLDRSRAAYPQVTEPGSPLSQAFLRRVAWLNQNNVGYFSDPNWPMKVTAAEALALKIRPVRASEQRIPGGTSTTDQLRYLAVVTSSFAVTETSFRKGQQIILETLEDNGRRGTTMVDGRPVLLWLDNVKVLRQITPGEAPVMVKIVSAQYGYPGKRGYSVSGMIQSLISPSPEGNYEIIVSDALLTPAAAQQQNARPVTAVNPITAKTEPVLTAKILTVVYVINGVTKTKQATEGNILILD